MFTTKQVPRAEVPSPLSHKPDERWASIKQDLHRRLIQAVDHNALRHMSEAQVRSELRLGAEELCRLRPDLISSAERNRLIDEVVDETLGFGPLEQLLKDAGVSDILINGPKMVYIERDGTLEPTNITFHNEEHLLTTIQKIVSRVGRRIDESSPMVDARLPDGSRVNVIIRPLAVDGALVSIRRFRADAVQAEDMLRNKTLSPAMLEFLAAIVRGRANVIISGGTGSGKTTFLNMLSSFIPSTERVVTIEDAAELQLNQPHVARLETRPPNLEGSGEYTARDLLRNALRMRPDRILIGECRGGEAFDMLQAMNTGHEGGLTTLHANNTRDALGRLQMLIGMSSMELSPTQLMQQIAGTISFVVQVARLSGGVRKVTQISEVVGVQNQEIQTRDIFRFEQQGIDDKGVARGRLGATGAIPHFVEKLHSLGIQLDKAIFTPPRSHPRAKPTQTIPHVTTAQDASGGISHANSTAKPGVLR